MTGHGRSGRQRAGTCGRRIDANCRANRISNSVPIEAGVFMSVELSESAPAPLPGPRARLLRRLAAFLLDCLIIGIPFQAIAIVLYLGTNGAVYMSSGVLSSNDCNQMAAVPANLEPAPAPNSNFALLCIHSLFGLEHGRTMSVGVSERNRWDPTTVKQYSIAPDGQVRDGWDIEWLAACRTGFKDLDPLRVFAGSGALQAPVGSRMAWRGPRLAPAMSAST